MTNNPGSRISLAEIAQHSSQILRRASSSALDGDEEPTLEQLAEILFFSPGDGRIWLNDRRVFLMHATTFGSLRKELIDILGRERIQELFTKLGFEAGARDAELVKSQWPNADLATAFNAGPRLHALEGVVKVTTIRFDFDIDRGTFYGEFLWDDSTEAMEHINAFGLSDSPVCWMQIGYASGYASVFMERLILYREEECSGMGHGCCRIVGRPADEWGDQEFELPFSGLREGQWQLSDAQLPRVRPGDFPLIPTSQEPSPFIGTAPSFTTTLELLRQVAPYDAPVMLIGEPGTGKGLFARNLHWQSRRSNKPFISVNCAAIPDDQLEIDLFGVERGAFSSAIASRAGRFERAAGGTLLLEEVNALSPIAQGKLLNALKHGEIERVGGRKPIKVNARLVVTSSSSLSDLVKKGAFRRDLFHRLNVSLIEIPPLRDRRDDIPLLMTYFLEFFAQKHRKNISTFTRRATEALLDHIYAGNISELQGLIERGVIMAVEGSAIDISHMFRPGEFASRQAYRVNAKGDLQSVSDTPRTTATGAEKRNVIEGSLTSEDAIPSRVNYLDDFDPRSANAFATAALDKGMILQEIELALYKEALLRANNNVSEAARILGITRAQLDYRIKSSKQ